MKDVLTIGHKRAAELGDKFTAEVERLLNSGAIDDTTPLNLVFGVALENLADNYLRGDKKTATYRNLRRF